MAKTAPQIKQEEIDTFATKVAKWAETLPDSHRSLAHVLVEHARELTPHTVALSKITTDLRTSAKAVVNALNLGATPQGWVRIDPVWEKKNKVELGEDIEIVQRVFMKTKG